MLFLDNLWIYYSDRYEIHYQQVPQSTIPGVKMIIFVYHKTVNYCRYGEFIYEGDGRWYEQSQGNRWLNVPSCHFDLTQKTVHDIAMLYIENIVTKAILE